jgi:lysine-specific demethylase/histidyl-hydroxylase NO66
MTSSSCWPHEAATGDGESLHVTVGLHPPTRLDVLHAALDAAAVEEVELRRGAASGVPPTLLEGLGEELAPERVAAQVRRRFVASRRAILDDQLDQVRRLPALHATAALERRDTVIADLRLTDGDNGGATLLFEGKEVAFPPAAREAVVAVHETRGSFTARSLPGPLDEPSRLVLARRLVREGYLRML